MSARGAQPAIERRVPLPLAFDTAIGYWTGEPDWDLLEHALRSSSEIARLLPDLRRGPVELDGVKLWIEGAVLVLWGVPEAVERLAAEIEGRLAEG